MGESCPFESPNLKSAREEPHIVTAKLEKELEVGRKATPFPSPPFPNIRCSPLGIVPQKDPSESRLIHYLLYPKGSSVNYASNSDTISVIKKLGAGCFMAKTDMKSAFCIIPVHPKDHALLGMKWANQYYFDRALPMGCSSSCAIFKAFSSALKWLSKHLFNASSVVHILDDFLFIAPTKEKCQSDLDNFLRMCSYLVVPIAQVKTVAPFKRLQFAGITLDSVRQEARLPEDKLRKCQLLLHHFYTRRKVTLQELQSLLDLLNFTCSVVIPSCAFLRRMIDLTRGIQRLVHDLVLTSLRHNIMFRARDIQGVHNTPADYISRFQVDKVQGIVSKSGRISNDCA